MDANVLSKDLVKEPSHGPDLMVAYKYCTTEACRPLTVQQITARNLPLLNKYLPKLQDE